MKNRCINIVLKIKFLLLTDSSRFFNYSELIFLIDYKCYCHDFMTFTTFTKFPYIQPEKLKIYFIYSFDNFIHYLYSLLIFYFFSNNSYNNILKLKRYFSFEKYSLKSPIAFIHIPVRKLSIL